MHFPVPSPELMRLSVGNADAERFIARGKRSFEKVINALTRSGGTPDTKGKRFLEWGCGCGRMTRHAMERGYDVHGVDTNEDAVKWTQQHLSMERFSVCDPLPPLKFPANSFDFVYAGSVITHLSIENQFRWAAEIWRILKPNGMALLTFAGTYHFRNYFGREQLTVRALNDQPYLEVGDRKEGENSYGIAQTVGTLDYVMMGYERRLHIQADDILGAQDTVVFLKDQTAASFGCFLLACDRFLPGQVPALQIPDHPIYNVDGAIPNQLLAIVSRHKILDTQLIRAESVAPLKLIYRTIRGS